VAPHAGRTPPPDRPRRARVAQVGVTRHGLAIFLQRHAPGLLSAAVRLIGITTGGAQG
jgi:hypothetical protein